MFNSCRTDGGNVPNTFLGFQYARTGGGMVAITYYYNNANNYFQVKLLDSLKIYKNYYIEFYVVNTKAYKLSCNNISLLLTQQAIYADTANNIKIIPANAQIFNYNNPIITDTNNWVKVSAIYKAQGGEQFITLGNFKPISQTSYLISKPNGGLFTAGYFVDDVAVYNLDSFCLKADAGRDTTIKLGDSVFIGSYTNGLDTIKWYNGSGQVIDSIRPGFWFTPTAAGTYMYILQQTVNGCFSADTVWVNVTTLPLKMVDFTAIYHPPPTPPQEGNVLLQWQTANEINVSHYNIERSFNGNDFTVIGKVKANNKSYNKYNFIDELNTKDQYPKTLYYRIAGVDFDGRKTFSQTKTINYKPQTINVSVFPNPAKDWVHIESKEAIKEVRVIDCWGKEVSKSLVNSQSTYKLVINNYQLSKGLYVVQVTTVSGKVLNEKLIVQ